MGGPSETANHPQKHASLSFSEPTPPGIAYAMPSCSPHRYRLVLLHPLPPTRARSCCISFFFRALPPLTPSATAALPSPWPHTVLLLPPAHVMGARGHTNNASGLVSPTACGVADFVASPAQDQSRQSLAQNMLLACRVPLPPPRKIAPQSSKISNTAQNLRDCLHLHHDPRTGHVTRKQPCQ